MSLRALLKQVRLKFGKFLIDNKKTISTGTVPKKILFLRQDGKIGDYIVSSFVFREIKKQLPNAHIAVVCTTKDAYLFEQNKHIDQLYFVRKRHILDYIKCGLILKRERYDVVIDPTIVLKNRDLLLLRLINAKNYVGYKKSDYQLFNFNIEGEYHFSELYRLALAKVGIEIQDMTYDVPYNAESAVEIKAFLTQNNICDYSTINFYGAYRIKKVNNENIKKYLRYLTDMTNGKQFVLLSYPEVTPVLKELSAAYPNIFVHDTKTIFHTIELIRHCDQLISTDTSTVHIASGFNKKIIAIYKQDEIAFIHWKPMSQNDTHILFYPEDINQIEPTQIKADWLVK